MSMTSATAWVIGLCLCVPAIAADGAERSGPADPQAQLDSRLDAVLHGLDASGAVFAARVVDLSDGRELYARNADRPMMPASNGKLANDATGLEHFGPAHRFMTYLAIEGDDLWLIGTGDPGCGDPRIAKEHNQTPTAMCDRWADALRARGITHVRGRLYFDDGVFDDQWIAPTWFKAYLTDWYVGMIPVHYGKVRLPVVAAFVGVAIALLAVYAMWVTWLHHAWGISGRLGGYWALARQPRLVFELMEYTNAAGRWKWEGTRVTGFPLLLFWLGEFAAMLVAGVFMPLKAVGTDDPVCRGCGSVCKLVRPIARFAVDRKAELVAAVEACDFSSLLSHSPPRDDVEPQLSLRLLACPQCGQTNVVTVNHIGWTTNSQGVRKLQITPVLNQLLVPQAEAAELKGIIRQLAERPEAPVAQVVVPLETSPAPSDAEQPEANDQNAEA